MKGRYMCKTRVLEAPSLSLLLLLSPPPFRATKERRLLLNISKTLLFVGRRDRHPLDHSFRWSRKRFCLFRNGRQKTRRS